MSASTFEADCHCGKKVPESELRYPIEWNTCLRVNQCKQPGHRGDVPPWPGMKGPDDDDDDPQPTSPVMPVAPAAA